MGNLFSTSDVRGEGRNFQLKCCRRNLIHGNIIHTPVGWVIDAPVENNPERTSEGSDLNYWEYPITNLALTEMKVSYKTACGPELNG